MAVDGRRAGLIGAADAIKPTTPEALRLLRAKGIRFIMLTGDSRSTAEVVARALGREEVEAELLPVAKRDRVARLECLDCGEVGPAAELRSHAESGACKNFRVVTTISSAGGRVLDERVEVCQI